MTGWLLSYANWAILDILPWWSWLIFAGIAAGVIMWVVPVPTLNNALAITVAVIISGVGIKAWGYQQGFAFRDAQVKAQAEAEQTRLKKGFTSDAMDETKAADQAATDQDKLTKEQANVVKQATDDANGNPAGAPIVIPADVVDRLRSIGQ